MSLKQENAQKILKLLQKKYPDAHCALHFKNPFELLIATILSAQCTDERVNKVTPALFAKYPDAKAMAQAPASDIEDLIYTAGFYKNKTKSILSCSKTLVEKYNGVVPDKQDQLVELAGVGRKTANVVLGDAFKITAGIVVDTHVTRLANRFKWTKSENAVVIEKDLQKIVPKKNWIIISHWLIAHGRATCKARNPACKECFLAKLCPSYKNLV